MYIYIYIGRNTYGISLAEELLFAIKGYIHPLKVYPDMKSQYHLSLTRYQMNEQSKSMIIFAGVYKWEYVTKAVKFLPWLS